MLFGATMSLCMGVVCLLYYIYIDAAPEIREQLPLIERMVVLFTVLGLLGLAAFIPLRRQNRWLWPTQGLLLVGAVAIGITLWRSLSA
jgi:drug/metabolite transporter (DMT)-like permease